jgi:K+-transporting ATPase ATPase A chain
MLTASGWIQLVLVLGFWLLTAKPLGLYLVQVLDTQGKTWLDPILGPFERLAYKAMGVDPKKEQDWQGYAISMLLVSAVSALFTYAILRMQQHLPLNPAGFGPMSEHLAFNTAISFTTNTNWQSYGGENTLSYFSQMIGLVLHNFLSAAMGISVAAALVRGIARNQAKTLGNFWVDTTRVTLYLLLPVSLVFALFLVSQGMIQNFKPYVTAKLLEPIAATTGVSPTAAVETQVLPMGPVASQIAIKMLGTNGGGYFNANAAHPMENPTPFSDFVQILSIFLIPSALCFYLGAMVKDKAHGWTVWATMALLFLVGALVCWKAEAVGNPHMNALGLRALDGNMEGKETRFGIFHSALFATATTDASCGAVNSMHDSFTPLGGLVPLFNIHMSEVVFGGVGSGLYGMLVYVVLAVFIAGLMVGRTPEYLGKKIESYDVKMAAIATLVFAFCCLCFSALAVSSDWGLAGLGNNGPHGFSEILYAFSSTPANNGSAFAGLNANTWQYNTALGMAMFLGRFWMMIPVLALAGSLAAKKVVPQNAGSFPVHGGTFLVLLAGTIIIIGALTFFPALALGPIVEHYIMMGSSQLF